MVRRREAREVTSLQQKPAWASGLDELASAFKWIIGGRQDARWCGDYVAEM